MKRVIFLLVAPLMAAALYATLFSDLLPDKRSVALSSVDRGDRLKSLRSSWTAPRNLMLQRMRRRKRQGASSLLALQEQIGQCPD